VEDFADQPCLVVPFIRAMLEAIEGGTSAPAEPTGDRGRGGVAGLDDDMNDVSAATGCAVGLCVGAEADGGSGAADHGDGRRGDGYSTTHVRSFVEDAELDAVAFERMASIRSRAPRWASVASR